MGHQLARAALAAALTLAIAGCASHDDEPEDPLEIAREVAGRATATSATPLGATADTDTAAGDESSPSGDLAVPELPAPDPVTFVGRTRVVNLWVGPEAAHPSVDVWARRTFTEGPVLLASDVAFGAATPYFAVPPGHAVDIVGAGAGPDGLAITGVVTANGGQAVTDVLTDADDRGSAVASAAYDLDPIGTNGAPAPPAPGEGFVQLLAANTRVFGEQLVEAGASDAFVVGDGTPDCRHQRIEAAGFAPAVLGGTQTVELELAPGTSTITLHSWTAPERCAAPALVMFDVAVAAGASQRVIVYTPDGTSLATLALELPVGG